MSNIYFSIRNINNFIDYSDSLVLYYSGMEQCLPNHSWTGLRDHYTIHFILSGQGTFTSDNITLKLRKNQCFIIYPNTLVNYQADINDPWKYCWVGFHGLKADYYIDQIGFTKNCPAIECKKGNNILSIVKKLINEHNDFRARPKNDLYATSLLYRFLAEIDKNSLLDKVTVNSKEEYVKKAVSFIIRNYSNRISIEDVAGHVGIDRKYLSSLFKKTLNISPQEYLINYRMNKACELLAKDGLLVKEIANSVGYEDPLHFTRIFRKLKGISPSQYRQGHDKKPLS